MNVRFSPGRRSLIGWIAALTLALPGCFGGGDYTPPELALTLSGISPDSIVRPAPGAPDATQSVTVSGKGFERAGARLQVAGPGITVTSFHIDSDTRITAVLQVSSGASFGAHDIGVITDDLTSNTRSLRIVSENPPTLTQITPDTGQRGTDVPVTITGTNFAAGSTVVEVGGLVAVSNVQVVSPTRITATFTVPPGEALGDHAVRVSRNGEVANTLTFHVTQGVAPTMSAISPNSGTPGGTVPVAITGTGFVAGAELILPAGWTASEVRVINATQIITTVTIPSTAPAGTYSVKVGQFGALSNAVAFSVTGSASTAPVLTRLSPNEIGYGARTVRLIGANFTADATVQVSGGVVGVSNVTYVSPTEVTATFTVSGTVSPGPRNVTVTTAAGTSNPVPIYL